MVGQRHDNSQTDDWPDNLIGKHRQMLIDSGISAATAKARGYETIKDRRRLAAIGIPKVMLWITEGAKKADCAAQRGLCCVALTGVWNWRGTNESGGRAALADWHDIPLNDRDVVIAFDSDVARKSSPNKALVELARYLSGKGARVRYLHLPDDGDKTGLDDFLVDHRVEELMALVRPDPRVVAAGSDTHSDFSHPPSHTATPQQSWSGSLPGVAVLRNILGKVGKEVRLRGLVGEENLAKTIYLAMTSRLLDKQVSVGVKGHSSSGKSYSVETVTKFFPPQAFLEFTAMSEKALVYSSEEYTHRTIVIYEVTAMRENIEDDLTSYFIRTLLSEGRIVYDVTVKDRNGDFTSRKVIKEGPTNLIFTTTKTRVHAEKETRILSLVTDDSTDQTARVLAEIADESNGGNNLDEWIDFQLWLASEHAEHRVTIPYARELARLVPPVAVRLRRDLGAVLSLIRAHAMLHQLNRSRDRQGRIVATVEDYEVVRELVADAITEGVGATVSDTVRETVAAVGVLAITTLGSASVRAVAKHLDIDKSNAGRRLRVAADGGYIENLETRRGLAARWVIGDPLPDNLVVLPDAAQLRNSAQPVDQECCGVATSDQGRETTESPPEPEGEHDTCACGEPLVATASRQRGYCERCHLTGKAGQQ
jgi:Domain of unknown function (DUF3854)